MPTDVIMPQMGESIVEGTITKWLKKPGEKIQRDEPLFEISTDKVDAEIPAPAAGVLKEIKVPEGTTVQVNAVVAVIDEAGTAGATAQPAQPASQTGAGGPAPSPATTQAPSPAPPPPAAVPQAEGGHGEQPQHTEAALRRGDGARGEAHPSGLREGEEETEIPTRLRERASVEPQAKSKEQDAVARQKETVIEFPSEESEGDRVRSSPLVRRIAREHNVDLKQVSGTGLAGRITRDDILKFVEQHPAGAAEPAPMPSAARPAAPTAPAPAAPRAPAPSYAPAAHAPAYQAGAAAPALPAPQAQPLAVPDELVPMSPMRKKIAQRMVESKHTSAHVHSVYEVDLTRVVDLRGRLKSDFERRTGAKLTFMPFFSRAAIHAIRKFPIINASVEGENIRYHRNVNLGIAVALDWGLIVPVIKNSEELNFLGLQRAITDLAERARTKKLLPDDVQGGTFSITNPGSFGQMFGLPIILQPQVAIMGVGGIKKQPVVITSDDGVDSIAIRSIGHISLGYDHRVVDGAIADQFLREVAQYLQNWNEDLG